MHPDQYVIVAYIFFWLIRIRGCVRRWRQPLLRGAEWFFSIPVGPDFYRGAGGKLLRHYWLRMFVPIAIDIPIAIAIFASGRLALLKALILGLCALIHINHAYSVDLAERHAQAFAVWEAERPVTAIALSLKPRRLRDYTNAKLESVLALSSIISVAALIRYYFAAPEHSLRTVFGVPVLLIYAQLGMLFVKNVVVAWRTPVPQMQAAEHIELREQTRRYYLKSCDHNRVAATAALLFWPVRLSTAPANIERNLGIWCAVWVVVSILASIWVEIQRKQLVMMALRAHPVKLPDFLQQSEMARWPLCYQPSAPMWVLKGARGYSLNLAHTLTRWSASYLAGFAVLMVVLHTAH